MYSSNTRNVDVMATSGFSWRFQGRSSTSVTYSQSTWLWRSMTIGVSRAFGSSRAYVSAASSLSNARCLDLGPARFREAVQRGLG